MGSNLAVTVKTESHPDRLERAILRAVAYSDVFDYPLTAAEVHRYLVGHAAPPGEVAGALARLRDGALLCGDDGLVALAGRDALFATRRRRLGHAERLWPAARRWTRVVGRLPLVRMVAITGALAVDNVEADADIDLLVVTVPGRVWLSRALITQLVRAARLAGVVLCPNWLLADDALALDEPGHFAARELAQMVPLTGLGVYRRMRRLNPWADRWLPNASGPPRPVDHDDVPRGLAVRAGERLLGGRLGAAVDAWDRRRKTREILRAHPASPEVVLDARQCKGHVNAHRERIDRAYAQRLLGLGLDPGEPGAGPAR
ncbi:MAG: hypothetical protein MUC56_10065 [Thermoanaerobaculales bacterium]|nr:hypothetical protein [Thermoanaerobaculales bacterium]